MPSSRSIPADARRSLRLYNFFFPLALLALLPGIAARMLRRGGYRENFRQRFARYSAADLARFRERRLIWIHSISVGETFVALKLARAMHALAPDLGFIISVTTSTGFAEVRKAACEWIHPLYNPIDARSFVRRALAAIDPQQIVLIEGEAWPNLLAEAFARAIPVSLVNARMSPRSERRFRRLRWLCGPVFRLLDRICVPESADIDRWQSLGVDRARIRCTGSIKFDQADEPLSRGAEFRALLASLGVADGAPVIVAGSTWEPEEFVLARILGRLRRTTPRMFLILVPRHVERTAAILRQLASTGLRVVQRTRIAESDGEPADVLLVDVTGELREWFGLATVAFVGKSLPGVAQVGGQNPAEPALLAKPVVFGPHMENFRAVVEQLLAANGAVQARTVDELERLLTDLLDQPQRRRELSAQARATLSKHLGAASTTARELLPPPPRD